MVILDSHNFPRDHIENRKRGEGRAVFYLCAVGWVDSVEAVKRTPQKIFLVVEEDGPHCTVADGKG